jgi:hypothetical protein
MQRDETRIVLLRRDTPVAPHHAVPHPASVTAIPRAWAHRWRRTAAAAGAHRGVRLRGLIVEAGDNPIGLIVVTVERVPLACAAPALRVVRGDERAATVTLRGDATLHRNGRRVPLSRLRVGDLVRVTAGPGAASVTAVDPWHGRRAAA